jgi:hypothetical protein
VNANVVDGVVPSYISGNIKISSRSFWPMLTRAMYVLLVFLISQRHTRKLMTSVRV